MVSAKARRKSEANGFTYQDHYAAAANVGRLFEEAQLGEVHGDKNNSPDVLSIKRFYAPFNTSQGEAIVKLTDKEIKREGHKIYSVEVLEIEKPQTGTLGQSNTKAEPPPAVSGNLSLSQQSNESNTHAEITGPALQKRGEGWGREQWSDKDYSVERDYATAAPAPATPVQNEADKKRALTRISDIMNKLRKIRPVRQGVDAPKSVLGYTDQQKQIARHRWAGDWKTAAHEIGHIVDYKLGLRDRVANSAQLTAIQQELEALGVNTSSSSPYLRKPSSAERYPSVHGRRMARA